MNESGFTYRFLAAAIIVFLCSAAHYFGVFAEKMPSAEKILTYNTDVEFLKNKLSGKSFIRPANGIITTEFSGEHTGVDIASNEENEPVLAAKDGTVTFSGNAEGYGNCIKIEHKGGFVTLYGHMAKLNAAVGDKVKKGGKIGIMGSTGDSTGQHLHFEVIKNGVYINPKSVAEGL